VLLENAGKHCTGSVSAALIRDSRDWDVVTGTDCFDLAQSRRDLFVGGTVVVVSVHGRPGGQGAAVEYSRGSAGFASRHIGSWPPIIGGVLKHRRPRVASDIPCGCARRFPRSFPARVWCVATQVFG